jgi:hypothetical protein
MSSKSVANQRGAVLLSPPGGLISRAQQLRIENDLDGFHVDSTPHYIPHLPAAMPGSKAD